VTTLVQIAAATCFFGAFGFMLAAIFARDEAVGWRRVLAAVAGARPARIADLARGGEIVRIDGRAQPGPAGPLRGPASGADVVWYAAWATERFRDDFQRRDSDAHVAVFERSAAPVWVEDPQGDRLALDPSSLWVEQQGVEEGLPFGAAPGHRAWSFMPRRRSWAEWEANRAPDVPASTTEIALAPGAAIEVYGRPARTPEGQPTLAPARSGEGVVVLRTGGGVAALAAERAALHGERKRRRWRIAAAFGVGFVACVAAAAAIA
jgi:hypothetical protein